MAKTEGEIAEIMENYRRALERRGIVVDKLILFGSCVNGGLREESDIDVAIVSPQFRMDEYVENLAKVAAATLEVASVIEPHIYSTDAYNRATSLDFLGEIKRSGKVIYSRD